MVGSVVIIYSLCVGLCQSMLGLDWIVLVKIREKVELFRIDIFVRSCLRDIICNLLLLNSVHPLASLLNNFCDILLHKVTKVTRLQPP